MHGKAQNSRMKGMYSWWYRYTTFWIPLQQIYSFTLRNENVKLTCEK